MDNPKEKYKIFRVLGDSMDDGTRGSFEEGDIIFTKPFDLKNLTTSTNSFLNRVYVIMLEGKVLLKQIVGYDKSKGLRCHSYNTNYQDFFIKIKDIDSIYQLKSHQRKETHYGVDGKFTEGCAY